MWILGLKGLRSLSNDDGNGNENGKKSNRFRLAKQQQSASASRSFVNFFAVVARLRGETS